MSGQDNKVGSAASFSVFVLCLSACATTGADRGASQGSVVIVDPPKRTGSPTLLIAMPTSSNFVDVRNSLVSELQKNFNIQTFTVGPQTRATDIAAVIRAAKPDCLVLMNNATMSLYRQSQLADPTGAMPPAVLLMASFVEEAQPLIRRSTGIAYEVPGVTAFVNLRSVTTTPINRIGVIYRPAFRRFVERQTVLAVREHVEVISVSVPNDVTAAGLRDALRDLAKNKKVDAIWMLNDNVLVRDEAFLEDAWREVTVDAKLPLIVGVSNFVNPNSPLGTLAVVPDHEALGLQAANLIFDLSDSDWRVEGRPVELPLSVKTVVDVRLLRASYGLRPDALKHIDKALE